MTSKTLAYLRRRLRARLGDGFHADADSITVPASHAGGFASRFQENFHEFTIRLDGWEQHFIKSNADDAIRCFLYILSRPTRLKIYSRRGISYKWQVQFRENGRWLAYTSCHNFIHPYTGPLQLTYRSNRPLEELAA